MRVESKRATASTMAQGNSTARLYRRVPRQASRINDVLAALLFSLQSPCCDRADRATVLDAIEGLIRLEVDAGLLEGMRHGQ